ncbi:MAG: hypothetical protein ABIG31_05685 [Candidatus Omnitrophota bacterium]
MLEDNIRRIKERISSACARIGASADKITVVAVSKGRSVGEIKQAFAAGIRDMGENRVQEAISKYSELSAIR